MSTLINMCSNFITSIDW